MAERDHLTVLQAENAPLIALLEAHGIEWRLPPQPLAVALPESELSRLSTAEKVQLPQTCSLMPRRVASTQSIAESNVIRDAPRLWDDTLLSVNNVFVGNKDVMDASPYRIGSGELHE